VLFSNYHPSLEQSITQGGIPHCLLHPSNVRVSIALEDCVLQPQEASFKVCSDTNVSKERGVPKRRDPVGHCSSVMSYKYGIFRHAAAWNSKLSCFCLIVQWPREACYRQCLNQSSTLWFASTYECHNVQFFSVKSRMLQRTQMLLWTPRNTIGRRSTSVPMSFSIIFFTRERLFVLFTCVRLFVLFIRESLFIVFTK